MDLIAKIFSSFTYITWLIAGIAMLIGEVFISGSFFLLWLGVAAFFVGGLMWLGLPLTWLMQLVIFAIASIIFTILWRKFDCKQAKPKDEFLSNRAHQYLGKIFVVVEPIENGVGKIKIEDTVWRALSATNIPIGAAVKIISVTGASFSVVAVTSE